MPRKVYNEAFLSSGRAARKAWVHASCGIMQGMILMRDILHLQENQEKRKQRKARTSGVMGLLTGPHQTSFSEVSSLTIRLSEGERPVLAPE